MSVRGAATRIAVVAGLTAQVALGQAPGSNSPSAGGAAWQASGKLASASDSPAAGGAGGAGPNARESSARVTSGAGTLPNRDGQVWREYDIRAYTSRQGARPRPERVIVDWILRETGTEVWFSEPLGVLSADAQTLRVYHTPQVQAVVAEIVDRFLQPHASGHAVAARLVTISSPNWRTRALPVLKPVSVQTAGADAWLLSPENAAVLVADLRKRVDFREHNSANLLIHHGQTEAITNLRPLSYVRAVSRNENIWPGYELETGQLQEGFTLEISPLLSLAGDTIDAVVKCETNQVEKLPPVWLDVPTAAAPRQRVAIQVPQQSSWRLHERFRWPVDRVLLISCGMVATPAPQPATVGGLPNPFAVGPSRAEALLLLENRASSRRSSPEGATSERPGDGINFRGRY